MVDLIWFVCVLIHSIMENVNNAIPTSGTAVDPNALVNPDGGQTQQSQANPNALVNPDGGGAIWFWTYACGLWLSLIHI